MHCCRILLSVLVHNQQIFPGHIRAYFLPFHIFGERCGSLLNVVCL